MEHVQYNESIYEGDSGSPSELKDPKGSLSRRKRWSYVINTDDDTEGG